jgi:transcriptional regulator with GAF, ATPase, and Fis domain
MRVVARADAEGGERIDVLVPFSDEAKAAMVGFAEAWAAGGLPPVLVFNRPEEEPVTTRMLSSLGEPVCSVLSLPLIVEGEPRGALALIAEGSDRFNDDHVRLYATLKEPFFIAMSNVLEHEEVLRLRDRLADDNRYLNRELQRLAGDELVGADFGLREVMRRVRQVAPTESPVLLTGETGVGKDVIANAIHLGSSRREGPFIPVNCGAIPDSLIDSELFGHEKGAFTGAVRRKMGKFEIANGGTIFLDEVGTLTPAAQVKLLMVLQEGLFERVGGETTLKTDVRVIAATNADLKQMTEEGLFRKDLFYRLNVFPIELPPLRERQPDIFHLMEGFLKRLSDFGPKAIRKVHPAVVNALGGYPWPGNIRELENLVERAYILEPSDTLTPESFPAEFFGEGGGAAELAIDMHNTLAQVRACGVEEIERRYLKDLLSRHKGRINASAEEAGITTRQLHKLMKKYGYRKEAFKSAR